MLLLPGQAAHAAEAATGVYLLGSKSSMAGVLPPPGTYISTIKYFYSGDASAAAATGAALQQIGNVTVEADVELDARAFIELPTALWISPREILGGNLGLGIIAPVGWKDISVDLDARASLTLPNGRSLSAGQQFSRDDNVFSFGDPLLTAILGWHQGNWHWNLSGLLNMPIGAYDEDALANIGFNRWAADLTAAVTWFDPGSGHEVSVAAGFTFNGENPDTDYKTGTEFHAEFAAMQHLSQSFAIGLTGYHYDQISRDSGAGARLGAFKGRVTALGPNINYNFQWDGTPVSTSLRWLHEFDASNRLEGDAILFSAAIPIGIVGQ
jgi:hypothetical protein